MRLLTLTPVPGLVGAAALVDEAAAAFLAGALALEATDVSGDDFQVRFDGAIRDLATPWRAGDAALADARAAIAALDQSDPRVTAALDRVVQGQAFVQRGYSYAGRVLMDLPRPLTPQFARMALGRLGAAGRTIDASLQDAATAIRALATASR